MSVQIDLEDTIAFERPLTRVVKQNIRITNTHDQSVAFKVKTTAPRLYCVRPNSDIIPPKGTVDVQIMLQAFREEPALDVKCKDKFLILSAFVNEKVESMNLQDLWSYFEEKEKTSIHQRKLRCVYVQPNEDVGYNPVTEKPNIAAPAANASVATTTTNTTSNHVQPASKKVDEPQASPEEVTEKMRKMEEELKKYKKEVEGLREAEPVVVEKLQVKTAGHSSSIVILLALLVAAVAYFVYSK